MILNERLADFYRKHLPDGVIDGTMLKGPCPFCRDREDGEAGTITVYLGARSFFVGYFRCQSRCVPGGFVPHFARLRGIDPATVPGYDPDREPYVQAVKFPGSNINQDVIMYQDKLTPNIEEYFARIGVSPDTLKEMKIGYNGRYIVYPYFMQNGKCYTAHCIMPEDDSERFWHGDQTFTANGLQIFNINDIDHCEDGALFVVEGERNLLCLRELGFPGIAVPAAADLNSIDIRRFTHINTVVMVMNHSPESVEAARAFAEQVGFKVRLLHWPSQFERGYNLAQLAEENPDNFKTEVIRMVNGSRAFSPFHSPGHAYELFQDNIERLHSESYLSLKTGMQGFDAAVGGIHGLNIMGGAPKAGKSCLGIQLATEIARKKMPVLYYDFENGAQKIYQRTLARLSRLSVNKIVSDQLEEDEKERLEAAQEELQNLLYYFRVV
ncbi:MAG: DNA helicase, partial [Deltaproteobacteria bacterium]|nr:DNA helicase [Deltaproteobacteria bacterium]